MMSEITTAARRITRTVNKEYGKYRVVFFDEAGNYVAARVGPGDPWPHSSEYHYRILPTLLGNQPVYWTERMVQDELDEQNYEREA
jgi:hypothetical protein